jgi:glycosyltransferase involved in cell wall biosynthesis
MLSGLRIGFVVPGAISQHSGGYLYDRHLVHHWRSFGASVDVLELCPSAVPSMADTLFAGHWGETLPQWSSYDCLVEDELGHPLFGALNRALRKSYQTKIFALVHNLSYRSQVAQAREHAKDREADYLASVDAILVNSVHTLATLADFALGKKPTCVVYPGLEPAIARAAECAGENKAHSPIDVPLRLLCVGHLSPQKGVEEMIDALTQEGLPAWQLEIVGRLDVDAAYVARIREAIARHPFARQIHLMGALYGDDLIAAYRRAELMMLASPEEGFGMAYLEAMAMGLPVVASAQGAAPELIGDGCEGWLFEPGLSGNLPAVVRRALHEAERWGAMGRSAQARTRRHPTWQESAAVGAAFLRKYLK